MTDETFIRRYTIPDKQICKDVISWFNSRKDLQEDGIIYTADNRSSVNKDIKESTTISLFPTEAWQHECFRPFLDWLWECVNDYILVFPELNLMNFALVERFNIQLFEPPTGGFKAFHMERQSIVTSRRLFVFMLYLNDVTDKGGTEFKYYNHTESAEEGKLLLWPPDFTHTHRGVVSPTQSKYIITGWYSLIPNPEG
jgi:prolyl 4-hydroxylase